MKYEGEMLMSWGKYACHDEPSFKLMITSQFDMASIFPICHRVVIKSERACTSDEGGIHRLRKQALSMFQNAFGPNAACLETNEMREKKRRGFYCRLSLIEINPLNCEISGIFTQTFIRIV